MKNSHADFAQVVAGIRTGLYDLADCAATKGDRETIMKAAACLAFFESDLLIKSAGPILPGETV